MATTAIYNEVVFSSVFTEDISSTVRKDRIGNKDPIMNDISVTFRGVATLGNADCGIAFGTSDIAGGMDRIIRRLSMPRRNFRFSIDGLDVFDVRPAQDETLRAGSVPLAKADLDNGPTPEPTVLKIVSSRSAWFRLTVKFSIAICDEDEPVGDITGVTNLSWTVADDIDGETMQTTRVFRGELRQRDRNLNPHRFRHLTWPPLVKGFTRERVHWDDSGDQMALTFEIVDKEWYATPPKPATTWECVHRVSSPVRHGTRAFNSMYVSLSAPPSVDKVTLLERAADIALSKVNFRNTVDSDQASMLTNVEIVDHLAAANRVEFSVTMESYGEEGTSIFNLAAQTLGIPIHAMGIPSLGDYDGLTAEPHVPASGIAGILLVHTLPQNPCKPDIREFTNERPQYIIPSPTIERGQRTVVQKRSLKPYPTSYRNKHKYGNYLITSQIEYETGSTAMPYGASSESTDNLSNKTISLYRSRAFRRMIGNGERLNSEVEMPPPDKAFTDENGIRHTPIDKPKISSNAAQVSADGAFTVNSLKYEIVYALDRAPEAGDKVPVGRVPYESGSGKHYTSFLSWPSATWIAAGGKPDSEPDSVEDINGD